MSKTIRIACSVKDHLSLDDLVPFQGDLKSLSKEDYQKLKKEILETGFAFPIYVWKSPEGVPFILGGHQRARTLHSLRDQDGFEIPPIPVVYIEAESAKAAKRRILQDVSQFGKIEGQGLYEFLSEIDMTPADVVASFRLPDLNMNDFLKEFFEDNTVPPDDPGAGGLPTEAKSKKGDLWILGEHRLICGDATILTDVERLMGQDRADLIWTDPPYNVAYEGSNGLTIENDDMDDGKFYEFIHQAFTNMFMVAKPGGPIYVAHADKEGLNFRRAFKESGFLLKQCLIWAKQQFVMGRQDYHWQHEPILYGWAPGAAHVWTGDRKQSTLLHFDRPPRNEEHPTMKPLDLIEYCLGNSSEKGAVVLDLFGGSGSTLMACERMGRKGRLSELDPKYVDVILNRWSKATGQDPFRDDGVTWSSLNSPT